jgi:hypothetical protein
MGVAAAASGSIPSRAVALYSFHRQPHRKSKTEACFTAQQICFWTCLKKKSKRGLAYPKTDFHFRF